MTQNIVPQQKKPYSILFIQVGNLLPKYLGFFNGITLFRCWICGGLWFCIQFLERDPKPDLYIVDFNLESTKSGFDFAKKNHRNLPFPICILNLLRWYKKNRGALAYNLETYSLKPFKSTDLFTTIEIVRNRKKLAGTANDSSII